MTEKISELIDGRGEARQRQDLFDHIIADRGARATWRRYHLIGCVLRGEAGGGDGDDGGDGADTCARIDARLADEPALRRRAWRTAGLATAATLALAASLAFIAVIVLQPPAPLDGGDASATGGFETISLPTPPLAAAETCEP